MTHEKTGRRRRGRGPKRATWLLLALAVAISAHWTQPLPALAETGSTQLYVERTVGNGHADEGSDNAGQTRTTVSDAQTSPQTGDGTDVALVAAIAVGGAGATILGYAARKRGRRTLPTIPYGTRTHATPGGDKL